MTDSTPPFSALRALEAAARHRSFTSAARELHVTHSAVSQAVRRLETELGTRLFERRGGAMEPSDAARRLAESYSAASQQLTEVIREITGEEPASRLAVRMPEEIERAWLAERRSRLSEAMPDVEFTISDARAGGQADVEMIIAAKLKALDQPIAEVVLVPAAAASVAAAHSFVSPDAILSAPLLDDGSGAWSVWAARYCPGRRVRPQIVQGATSLIDAAVAGKGVALLPLIAGQSYFVRGDLTPLPFAATNGRTLALRSRAAPAKAESVERFAMWMKLELARDAAQLRRLPSMRREFESSAIRSR